MSLFGEGHGSSELEDLVRTTPHATPPPHSYNTNYHRRGEPRYIGIRPQNEVKCGGFWRERERESNYFVEEWWELM